MKAHNHATNVLYRMENTPHFQLPASLATAVMDAMQGTYSDTNIRKLAAINGVKSGEPVAGLGCVSLAESASGASSPPAYNTPNVLTISSLAAVPDMSAMVIFQLNPNGSNMGDMARPMCPI